MNYTCNETAHTPARPYREELNSEYQDDQILKVTNGWNSIFDAGPLTSPPFVNAGDRVEQGDTVMIIEAMKVMNPISAHRSGVVKEVLGQASEPVEFNQWLLIMRMTVENSFNGATIVTKDV